MALQTHQPTQPNKAAQDFTSFYFCGFKNKVQASHRLIFLRAPGNNSLTFNSPVFHLFLPGFKLTTI